MSKFIPLSFCAFLFSTISFAQKIDYDNTSKWFLGFNVGATWQTTDVANKTYIGYGFVLGKSFNYNYGRKIAFDLRGRYLKGTWYGQDYDTTSLANYKGTALIPYKDTLGFTVNNFQADVHRLALELVIHANGIRERTGWDPYIFGGVGFTWHQTFGDLKQNVNASLYNYDPSLQLNQTYINSLLDKVYDSPLDGSNKDKFRIGFMPSLGFGLGYQVGKRVSMGLEHKTTFTLIDDFDGVVATSKYRDLYHYTSFFINFRFRTHTNTSETGGSSLNNVDNYNQGKPCQQPSTAFLSSNPTQTTNSAYNLAAQVIQIGGAENIIFRQNGMPSTAFSFNPQTHRFDASILLIPGMNTFSITASNACGSVTKTFSVNYQNCVQPTLQLLNATNGATLTSPNFILNAETQNMTNGQGQLNVTHNGATVSTATFNSATGTIQAPITLAEGFNTIVVSVTNACGTATQTLTLNYQACLKPVITYISPTLTNTTVKTAAFNLTALVQSNQNAQISLTHNGRNNPNFSYNKATGNLSATINLAQGANTFTITASNTCGTTTETITVNYSQCQQPTIAFNNAVQNGATVTSPAFTFNATVLNSTNGVSFTQNGRGITNYNLNPQNGMLAATVNLVQGANTFVITASNTCGTATETFTVYHSQCQQPTIAFNNTVQDGATVTNSAFMFNATVLNSTNGMSFTQNGRSITNFNLNPQNGMLAATVNLVQGVNTFVIRASNTCGMATETFIVYYSQCQQPTIAFNNAVQNGATVTNPAFTFNATVLNSTNGVSFTQNGRNITNYNLNSQSGMLGATVNLVQGANTFVITTSNTCGTATATFTVYYSQCQQPTIAFTNPTQDGTTVNSRAFTLSATVLNSNGQGITFTHNGKVLSTYTLNPTTGAFTAPLVLAPNANTFTITVTNPCGTATQTITVNNSPCLLPVITFTNPAKNGLIVDSPNFTLNASILNNEAIQAITLTQNGKTISNYTKSAVAGSFANNVTLVEGLNTFVLSITNPCGVASETVSINYVLCKQPTIAFTNPTQDGTTVNSRAFTLSATVLNSNGQGITFTHNGKVLSTYTLNPTTGAFTAPLVLAPNANTFTITATNPCGTATQTITVNNAPCLLPVITFTNPAKNGLIVNSPNFILNASILNNEAIQAITLTQNGKTISNYTKSAVAGSFANNVTLVEGLNTFVLSITNPCGVASETVSINYVLCKQPTIAFTNPTQDGTTVNSRAFTLSATVLNSNGQGITFTHNGKVLSTYTLNPTTGAFTAPLVLAPNANTFTITATNPCGTATQTITVNNAPCLLPAIAFTNPTQNGTSVYASAFELTTFIANLTSEQGISITQNGQAISFRYNAGNSSTYSKVTLTEGANTFVVTSSNGCGTDSETITLIYVPCQAPSISFGALRTAVIPTIADYTFTANIFNCTNLEWITLTQNGRVIRTGTLDESSGSYTATTSLNQGANTFIIKVVTPCGTATETTVVNYTPCSNPSISFTQPRLNGVTVKDSVLNLNALIQGANNEQSVSLTLNGKSIRKFLFSIATGNLQSLLTLNNGINTIVLTVQNDCGVETKTITVNYIPIPKRPFELKPSEIIIPPKTPTRPSQQETSPSRGGGRGL